ncbi:MAG TPA: NAD-dependent epimerase/dehydratase family protein [Solirubrobacteraceae bacterium]|jgi:UDP-glucose 4-epimerase|nr:NAD-dependent epimerase/dehydratase family protein [Solirubrobacteraceae bacterium]
MRVLVTGGSGFIGSHVVDKLRLRGHQPVIYDLRPSPWHESGSVETVLGSITDRAALELALQGCDAVAHLAAVADVNDVHREPEDAERVNARGTVTVLEAARRSGVKRIIYASTIWVYSDCAEDDVNEETLLPPPSHLYTSTKLAGELYCKAYQELYGIDFTILRFGIPYGPRAREAAVIPAFVNKALKGEPLTLAGDGSQSRRFVYVEDLAEGVALGLNELAANRVYNLASNETVTIKQIAETVRDLMGEVEIVYTPARPGDFGGKVVSSERAERELGWTAATPFHEGVRRYVGWRAEQATAAEHEVAQAVIPAGEPDTEAEPRKVLIISADIGEGHDLPARAVAREFADEDPDARVSIVNGLPAMGPLLTKVLRENSAFMFRWIPWLFDIQYWLFMYFPPTRWLASRLLTALGRRGLMRLIRAENPDVILSTYPGVTGILGELRRRGKLKVPCYSSITDLAGLRFWAHPYIDLHFITHPESLEEAEGIAGAGSVRWAKPPTLPSFLAPRERAEARRSLDLGDDALVIAVSGGGWGVGDLASAVEASLAVPDAIVLALCGRNDKLRARLAKRFPDEPRLRLMGFTDRMGDVLAASNALVHSSAGLTVLEAIIRGCPVVSFGFGYGHVRASNAALERFGLAEVVRNRRDLGPAIERALAKHPEPDGSFARRPSTASLIFTDERRIKPMPAWRLRTVQAAATAAAVLAIGGWTFTTTDSYSLLSNAFGGMRPVNTVETSAPVVGVLIDAPGAQVPSLASAASRQGYEVTFSLGQVPSAGLLAALRADEEQAVPLLPSSGLVRWLGTRGDLHRLIHSMGFGHHFFYTSRGFSVGQYLFAHGAGGRPIAGAVQLQAGQAIGRLHAGEVIELKVRDEQSLLPMLIALHQRLVQDGLHAVPVAQLMRDATRTT